MLHPGGGGSADGVGEGSQQQNDSTRHPNTRGYHAYLGTPNEYRKPMPSAMKQWIRGKERGGGVGRRREGGGKG